MKAIMISIKPKWCAKIMNGEKTIEVRKNKALAKAIQKLINEYGYADIYVYCSKEKPYLYGEKYEKLKSACIMTDTEKDETTITTPYWTTTNENVGEGSLNSKVLFKFRCYKVEEITPQMWTPEIEHKILEKSCLKEHELFDYICSHDGTEDKPFYAIHISDLEIFDEPKELSEFIKCDNNHIRIGNCFIGFGGIPRLTKAPQNYCYIETGD